MNYIGSKQRLLDFLEQSILEVAGSDWDSFCDIFAGTGVVGRRFRGKGYKVFANDLQYYSYVLNRHYIGNGDILLFKGLIEKLPSIVLVDETCRGQYVCDYLSSLKGIKGYVFKNYCKGGTIQSGIARQYFSDKNGMRCDAIRQQIESWMDSGEITDDEYFFLLASLIESIDKYANTASVYGAFLKKLKKSAAKSLVLTPADLQTSTKFHEVFNEDANVVAGKINCDVLYLDPPYNQRQYAANYHLLETIAKYDNPVIHGKTGLRDYTDQKSSYCSRNSVKDAFRDLIVTVKAKYIFLSYNNEGLMSFDDVREIMSLRGQYGCFEKIHNRYRADRPENRTYRATSTTEYLHYVICASTEFCDLKY